MKSFLSIGIWVIGGIGVCIGWGCQPQPESKGETDSMVAVDKDPEVIRQDSIRKMILSLTEQIAMHPKNPALFTERSYLYYTSGKTTEAIQDIEKAISINPKDAESYYLRGFYELVGNRDSTAKVYLLKAVDLGSENPETYYSLGNLEVFIEKYNDARKWYLVAMKKDSLDPAYPFAYGLSYYQQKNYSQALVWFNKSLDLDPYYSKTLSQLYTYYFEVAKNVSLADKYNNQMLTADSLHPIARFNRASVLLQKGLKLKSTAAENSKSAYVADSLLFLAVEEYTRSLTRSPGYVLALYNRGYAYRTLGLIPEAKKDFEKVLRLDPYHSKSYFMLATLYEYGKDYENAKKFYEIALQLQPDFPEAEAAIEELDAQIKK